MSAKVSGWIAPPALIWNNVRFPEGVKIDNYALMAALKVAENRIVALLDKYGKGTVLDCVEEMLDRMERSVRTAPHVTAVVEVDLSRVVAHRAASRAAPFGRRIHHITRPETERKITDRQNTVPRSAAPIAMPVATPTAAHASSKAHHPMGGISWATDSRRGCDSPVWAEWR